MPTEPTADWAAIHAHPTFRELHARKARFLWGLLTLSIAYYFLLPVGAAYFADWYRIPIWDPINVGLLFAWSQFVVAWGVAYLYARKASEFDALADAIAGRITAAMARDTVEPNA